MPAFWLRTGTFQELKINLWQAGSCKSLQQSEEGGGFEGGWKSSLRCSSACGAVRGQGSIGQILSGSCHLPPSIRATWRGVIRSPWLQPAGTWALSISRALDEAQRDAAAGNEMWLCQTLPEGGGHGCTHFLGASLLLLLKWQVSGVGSWRFGFIYLCRAHPFCQSPVKKQFI